MRAVLWLIVYIALMAEIWITFGHKIGMEKLYRVNE